jgi:hypothetical protein
MFQVITSHYGDCRGTISGLRSGRSLLSFLAKAALRRWRRYPTSFALSRLDDHMLRDIGLRRICGRRVVPL